MITDEQLNLIEMTLEQPVDDIAELAQRAISLHQNCTLLLDEVKRQRTLLALGVRVVVTPTSTSTGTNDDAPRIPVAAAGNDASPADDDDASVPAGERIPTVDQLAAALVDAWGPTDHGMLCPRSTKPGVARSGPCTCWISSSQAPRLAVKVRAALLDQVQS